MTPEEIIAAGKLPVSEEEKAKRAKSFSTLMLRATIEIGERRIRMTGFDWDTHYQIERAKAKLLE